ncbi:MAG: hypothetical protein LBN06_02010 [Prevotellaceae bacterium]|nr:hypothetical protein [Prevotellaceae bacterium]
MKVLFLDIDGVLQPLGRQTRFEHKDEYPELAIRLNKEIPGDFDYADYIKDNYINTCDLGAVYYDWDKPAMDRLRRILDTTGAKIVLSSTWRDMGKRLISALMAIHQLDHYLIGATFCVTTEERHADYIKANQKANEANKVFQLIRDGLKSTIHKNDPKQYIYVEERAAEIREYLDRHPEIIAYVAVDDINLENGLEGHFVGTNYRLEEKHVQPCLDILNREDGPYPLNKEAYAAELNAWREKNIAMCGF